MNFEDFSSKIGGTELAPLTFHLLAEPVVIRDHLRSKYSAFALAWTGGREDVHDTGYVYALAVRPGVGKYELCVLRQYDCPKVDDTWYGIAGFFFKAWVRDWLQNHPSDLVNGAIHASRIDWR